MNNSPMTTDPFNINLSGKGFSGKAVLGPISLTLEASSFTVITGPSGCGKSTLLKIVAGLDPTFPNFTPTAGTRTGIVFQEPRLLPWRSLRENVRLVNGQEEMVDQLLNELGLSQAAELFPQKISLGMARRAALARALVIKPNLLLLDEPLVSLDQATAEQLRNLLLDIWQNHRPTVLMVTHDMREALALADRIIIMGDSPCKIIREHHYLHPQQLRTKKWIEQELSLLTKMCDAA